MAARSRWRADTRFQAIPSVLQIGSTKSDDRNVVQESRTQDDGVAHLRRPLLVTFAMQATSILWVVPITILLYLNFSGFVIGQSAWCPDGNSCNNGTFDYLPKLAAHNMLEYNMWDYDLLGALQLVAKAREVWFICIALWFVYLLTINLAAKDDGLPVESLTRAYRLGELWDSIKPRMFQSMIATRDTQSKHNGYTTKLCVFYLLTTVVSVLCALMGPATAILAIPAQQWLETPKYVAAKFEHWNSAEPPTKAGWTMSSLTSCTQNDLNNKRWSCAYPGFGFNFDTWLVSILPTSNLLGIQFSQPPLTFVSNITGNNNNMQSDLVEWIPSRQLINKFANDQAYFSVIEFGAQNVEELDAGNPTGGSISQSLYEQYAVWRKALQLEVQRLGPILTPAWNEWPTPYNDYGNDPAPPENYVVWTTTVDENRQIRCYPYWALQNAYTSSSYPIPLNNYTRCTQIGSGWGPNTKSEHYQVAHPSPSTNGTSSLSAEIWIYSADKTAFLPNGMLPSGVDAECLRNGTVPSEVGCDWDKLFEVDHSTTTANMTRYANTIEIRVPGSRGEAPAIIAFDYVIYSSFTLYTFDPSTQRNYLGLVQTQDLPIYSKPIPVDPNWYLAMWSVDGSGTIPSNRSASLKTMLMSQDPGFSGNSKVDLRAYDFLGLCLPASLEYMLTVIDYETTPIREDDANNFSKQDQDSSQPFLTLQSRYLTWGYSSNSRASHFGIAIAIAGVVVAIAHTILATVDKRPYRSLTDMLIAALEHYPMGEFQGAEQDSAKASRVTFRLIETTDKAGRLLFEPSRMPYDKEDIDVVG